MMLLVLLTARFFSSHLVCLLACFRHILPFCCRTLEYLLHTRYFVAECRSTACDYTFLVASVHSCLLPVVSDSPQLFTFADTYRGSYDASITDAANFYKSWSGYEVRACVRW